MRVGLTLEMKASPHRTQSWTELWEDCLWTFEQAEQLVGPELPGELEGVANVSLVQLETALHELQERIEQLLQGAHLVLGSFNIDFRVPRTDQGNGFLLDQAQELVLRAKQRETLGRALKRNRRRVFQFRQKNSFPLCRCFKK
mgnify:CR=1 FL=1